jgi:inner membrane protease ATP23
MSSIEDFYSKYYLNIHMRCLNNVKWAIRNSERVRYLIDSIEKSGCTLPSSFIHCQPCEKFGQNGTRISGGYRQPSEGVDERLVMCEDKLLSKKAFENVLTHELIHAFDSCRSNARFENCEHHACTEIRAAMLSGECSFKQELSRGKFGILAHFKVNNNLKKSLKL